MRLTIIERRGSCDGRRSWDAIMDTVQFRCLVKFCNGGIFEANREPVAALWASQSCQGGGIGQYGGIRQWSRIPPLVSYLVCFCSSEKCWNPVVAVARRKYSRWIRNWQTNMADDCRIVQDCVCEQHSRTHHVGRHVFTEKISASKSLNKSWALSLYFLWNARILAVFLLHRGKKERGSALFRILHEAVPYDSLARYFQHCEGFM